MGAERSIAKSSESGLRVVGISELAVSTDTDEVLVTYSLGACLGMTLYDPQVQVGGLIHCMLPQSRIDPEKARMRPAMFVDTGVRCMLESMYEAGAVKDNLSARVAGAASLMDNEKLFQFGGRNLQVLRVILQEEGIPIVAEDVGGTKARTLILEMESGITKLKSGKEEVIL